MGGGGQGGANSKQAHYESTSFRRHVPIRFLINQCQIITFLILKFDYIENSRIELKGIVLPVPSIVRTLNPKKSNFNVPAIRKEFLYKFDKYNILAL